MAWPTTDDPRTEFVTVRFTTTEVDDIDWLIQQTGTRSRSAAVRAAVDGTIAAEKRKASRKKRSADTAQE